MLTFNENTVPAQPLAPGVTRQRLLTPERPPDTGVLLDRLTFAPGATMKIETTAKSLAWLQVLEGQPRLEALFNEHLSETDSVFLPPAFNVTLTARQGASVLYLEMPDAGRFDPGFSTDPPRFMVMDWKREPVFKSEHDERKRVSLVNPIKCNTNAIRIDVVIYPAGTMSPNYRLQSANSFVYMLRGRGTARVNEQPFSIRPGGLIFFTDSERHALKAADSNELCFIEFYIPGKFKTVWADPSKMTKWLSTDRDINEGETALDEKERLAYRHIFGNWFVR